MKGLWMVGQSESAAKRAGRPGRSGRRPGGSGSRDDILQAARKLFAERGYAGATIRGIAAAAAVDGALVHHFFSSKEKLFAAAVSEMFGSQDLLPPVLEGSAEGMGERLVRTLLGKWEEPTANQQLQALLRSAVANDEAAGLLRDFLKQELLGRIGDYLPGQDADLRAALISSQLVGVAFLRYVLAYGPLAEVPAEALVHLLSPTIQRYLSQPLTALDEGSAGAVRAKRNLRRTKVPGADAAQAPAKAVKAPAKAAKAAKAAAKPQAAEPAKPARKTPRSRKTP
jgi:AcrR family transcriptional regulator